MQIPKKLKVGKHWYTVRVGPTNHKYRYGQVEYIPLTIDIYNKRAGKPVPAAQMRETLWHELTHAILYDMGNYNCYNEKFVTDFSKRLSKAIDSAEF